MHRLLAIGLAAAFVVGACTSDTDTPPDTDSGATDKAPLTGNCDPELADAFSKWGGAGFSGSIAVTAGGRPVCLAGVGLADQDAGEPNTPDTVFDIGSISKAFTAAAVLDLVDQGNLTLDTRAGDVVAGLAGPAAEVTVEQLVLHTSGLTGSHGDDYVPLDRGAAIAALGQLELVVEPGTEFLYSNSGYTLLALIVEEASGTGYRDVVTAQLAKAEVAGGFWHGEPAAPEPRAVGYLEDGSPGEGTDFAGPHWAVEGNGGLAMTTGALSGWADALLAGEVISSGATETLRILRFDNGDGTAEAPGWVVFDEEMFGEPAYAAAGGGGTGHNVVVAVLPESRRVVAFASNTADITAEDLLQAVGPALAAGEPLPEPETGGGAIDPAAAEAIEGTYTLDTGGTFAVEVDGDRLAVAASGADTVEAMLPLPDDADEAADHEQLVRELLAGETRAGREELAAIEEDFGPVDDVELVGTIVRDGELRTYVRLTSGEESVLAWYALDGEGGVAAVELDPDPPTLLLAPAGDSESAYEPDDPTGETVDVTVTFGEGEMSIEGPTGTVTARRVG